MKNNYTIPALLLSLISIGKANSAELALGIQAASNSIWIEDTSRGDGEIAKMESGMSYSPSASIRTKSKYFLPNSNWGYHYQLDGSIFKIDKQDISNFNEEQDVGTSISGYSLYAVPVGFYHFNRHNPQNWSFKAGIGVGLGYLKIKGNFKITDDSHPEVNSIKRINTGGVDMAIGIYLEANLGRHLIVIQNYGPVLESNGYEFQQHNVVIAYRYVFNVFE